MYNIGNFLQKFLTLEKDNNTKISIILDLIKKETNLELSKDNIEIKGDNLKIKCNACFRNEIFMHQFQIESLLRSQKIFLKMV
jgi:hypothetical protein